MASGTIKRVKTPTLTWTNGSQDLPTSSNVGANWDGHIEAYGGNNGTTVVISGQSYSVAASSYARFPVRKGEAMRYTGGPYSWATLYYRTLDLSFV